MLTFHMPTRLHSQPSSSSTCRMQALGNQAQPHRATKPHPLSMSSPLSKPSSSNPVKYLPPRILSQWKEIRRLGSNVCIVYLIEGECNRKGSCRYEHPPWDGHSLSCCVASLRGVKCTRGSSCKWRHIEKDGVIFVPATVNAISSRQGMRRRPRLVPSICPSSSTSRSSSSTRRPVNIFRGWAPGKSEADSKTSWRTFDSPPSKPAPKIIKPRPSSIKPSSIRTPPGLTSIKAESTTPHSPPPTTIHPSGLDPNAEPFCFSPSSPTRHKFPSPPISLTPNLEVKPRSKSPSVFIGSLFVDFSTTFYTPSPPSSVVWSPQSVSSSVTPTKVFDIFDMNHAPWCICGCKQ